MEDRMKAEWLLAIGLVNLVFGLAATSTKTTFRELFIKIPNSKLASHNLLILENIDLEGCARNCAQSSGFDCLSFDYDSTKGSCTLHDISAGFPLERLADADYVDHASRIVTKDNWLIIPWKRLISIRDNYDSKTVWATSQQDCMQQCKDEKTFWCRSVDYAYDVRSCMLHSADVHNTTKQLTEVEHIDHFETDYLRLFRRRLPTEYIWNKARESQVDVWTLEECARRCALEVRFKCRVLGYLEKTGECWLSDKEGLTGTVVDHRRIAEEEYYERIPEGSLSRFINYGVGKLRSLTKGVVYNEVIKTVPLETCAQRCLEQTTFHCKSFDYRPLDSLCSLSEYISGNVHGLESAYEEFFHFEIVGEWMLYFYATPSSSLSNASNKTAHLQVSPDKCAHLCVTEDKFICRSFDYQAELGTCFLSEYTGSDVGGLYKRWMIPLHHFEMKPLFGCGGNLTDGSGDLASPNWPRHYDNGVDCNWEITAPKNKIIEIKISHFNIHRIPRARCMDQRDRLIIYEGNRELCWKDRPQTWYSSANSIRVRFQSDNTDSSVGFRAFYKMVWPCKNITFTQEEGEFASPNWPDEYENEDTCQWLFVAPESKNVSVTFLTFRLESYHPVGCTNSVDHIKVYDGFDEYSPVIGQYCGKKDRFTVSSSGRYLLVVFKSDRQTELEGFHARWKFNNIDEYLLGGSKSSITGGFGSQRAAVVISVLLAAAVLILVGLLGRDRIRRLLSKGRPEEDIYYECVNNAVSTIMGSLDDPVHNTLMNNAQQTCCVADDPVAPPRRNSSRRSTGPPLPPARPPSHISVVVPNIYENGGPGS